MRVASAVPDGMDVVVVPVWSGRGMPATTPVQLDAGYLEGRGFEGRLGETQALVADDGSAVVAVGVGERSELGTEGLRRAAAAGARAAGRAARLATTLLDATPDGVGAADAAQAVTEGVLLAAYSFTTFKSEPRPGRLAEVVIVSKEPSASAGAERGAVVARGVRLARDLINEPAGSLTPTRLADVASTAGRRAGLAVTVLDAQGAEAAGLGGLLGVARGSDEPPCVIELLYEPSDAGPLTPTVAFVGKGITFDSGGLSLKTAQGMTTMKTDMSGAAAVIGAMTAIAELGAPVRVLGLCPCTENMPSGTATKPGDVLRMRNAKTVEVLNTDAEGRLVLADALSLAVEAGVDAIVDLATLTGAVSVALGRGIAGLMGADQAFLDEVRAAADRAGESVWQLPLPEQYRPDLDSDIADLRNIGTPGGAGTLLAGLFLQEFTGALPWAHLDIAGTARSEGDEHYIAKGATGWGVRSLVELATGGTVALREGAQRRAHWAGRTPLAGLVKDKVGGGASAPRPARAAGGGASAPRRPKGADDGAPAPQRQKSKGRDDEPGRGTRGGR